MHIIQQFQDMSGQNKLTLLIYVWKINSFIKWQIHNTKLFHYYPEKQKRNYIITHIKHSYFTICLTYSIDCLGIRFTSNVGNHVKIIQGVVSQIYRFVSIVSFYNTKLSQNTNKGHTCANTKDYI